MALPLAPIAGAALRYGAVVAVGYYIARRQRGLPSTEEEAAHDAVDEGVSLRHHRGQEGAQANGDARIRRVIRFGQRGPGVEIDATMLGRVRLKRVRSE